MEIVKANDSDLAQIRYILGWALVVNCIEIAVVGTALNQVADYYGDGFGLHKYILGPAVISTFFIRLNPHIPKTYHLLKDLFTETVTTITGEVTNIREENFRMREHYLIISINHEEFTIEKTKSCDIDIKDTCSIRYFPHSRVVTSIQKPEYTQVEKGSPTSTSPQS